MTGILVTGASGFIGRHIAGALARSGATDVVLASRSPDRLPCGDGIRHVQVGSFDGMHDWSAALRGVSVVIHAAGRAHVLRESDADPMAAFRRTNVVETENLALQAASAGVRRFVLLSSVGVLGPAGNAPFDEASAPQPLTHYARSKHDAERVVQRIGRSTGMETVTIRPPLVYGPGAPGNFPRLAQLVRRHVPLPLARVHNLRSWIGVDNLVNFILLCTRHPSAANEIFLISDGHDCSTPAFVRSIAHAMGTRALLLPAPVGLLRAVAEFTGRRAMFQQLCGSLQLDISKAHTRLGWSPPVSVDEGLRRALQGMQP
nr:NAD-dependent epimerase/dehydratase family protein [Variovorax boronicumulans]